MFPASPTLQPVPTPSQVLSPVQQPVGTQQAQRRTPATPSFLAQISVPSMGSPNAGGKQLLGQ